MALTEEQRIKKLERDRRYRQRMSPEKKADVAQLQKTKREALKRLVADIKAIPEEDWTDEQRAVMDNEAVKRKKSAEAAMGQRDKNRKKFREYMQEYMKQYRVDHMSDEELAAREERRIKRELKEAQIAAKILPKPKLGSTWAYKKDWLARKKTGEPAPKKPVELTDEEKAAAIEQIHQKHVARREKDRERYLRGKLQKAAEQQTKEENE